MGECHEENQPILPVHSSRGNCCPPSRRDPVVDEDDCPIGLVNFCKGVIVLAVLFLIGAFWYGIEASKSLEYSVAIIGASGLDPVTDLRQGRGLLNPEFNLTISIKSPSAVKAGCIVPHTSIKVFYSHPRVPMAAGRAPDELCARPRRSSEPRQVVARGRDVALPGFVVDSLTEDMRRGDAMFEVMLTSLEPEGENDRRPWKMVTCWAKLGDATGAALKIPCVVDRGGIDKQESGYVPSTVPPAGPH